MEEPPQRSRLRRRCDDLQAQTCAFVVPEGGLNAPSHPTFLEGGGALCGALLLITLFLTVKVNGEAGLALWHRLWSQPKGWYQFNMYPPTSEPSRDSLIIVPAGLKALRAVESNPPSP